MTRRDRVMAALNFEPVDRIPRDLGGMPSTGISCFAYPRLRAALGLPPRPPKVYDTGQMLALPDVDVLDALDCDVVTICPPVTNAVETPELWHPFDFGGRLDALVLRPDDFSVAEDGTVLQPGAASRMPPDAFVFDQDHAGQLFSLDAETPRPDLEAVQAQLAGEAERLEQNFEDLVRLFERARASTDRAIMVFGLGLGMGIGEFTGVALFPLLCMEDPDFVRRLHRMITDAALRRLERLLPRIRDCVDVFVVTADDWGTQHGPIASPDIYRGLFAPYHREVNDLIHALAPKTKTFLHSCGAVESLIDDFIDARFDVLNPVQWTAGNSSPEAWKNRAGTRLALWGGGVNSQETLPWGTPDAVADEARRVSAVLSRGGGYVFAAIHNILAEVPPENIIALYRALD
ncbi:MAG TPA: uroporphyrinogen decarboxylase family protein [Candidatus Hydrogenedentes bacterium]|nr:uroporphyrinogen decarboxylase family protein [Candidatus Hydrogenedentota bacterium]